MTCVVELNDQITQFSRGKLEGAPVFRGNMRLRLIRFMLLWRNLAKFALLAMNSTESSIVSSV